MLPSLRTVVEDRAFRSVAGAGVGIGVLNLVLTYVDTGQVDIVGFVVFVALVAVFGASLVTYWNYADGQAEAE
jgi:hypothetical protein